jgi:hypothetical protein
MVPHGRREVVNFERDLEKSARFFRANMEAQHAGNQAPR